ncbi:hypothetical protein KVT40_003239 [Elsinoe batatas]|uniref:Uncharacterized protein n=1 Tax=Elsinoe batatas TaxID=2601811 RepID=A0A8K0L462_9PEZI|nr:hypothetical protein KVT40_003239 [Elsinoe batatas]
MVCLSIVSAASLPVLSWSQARIAVDQQSIYGSTRGVGDQRGPLISLVPEITKGLPEIRDGVPHGPLDPYQYRGRSELRRTAGEFLTSAAQGDGTCSDGMS